MKKYLPIVIIVVVGLALVGGILWLVRALSTPPSPATAPEEKALREYSIGERPFATLTPQSDGYRFDLEIAKVPVDVTTVDYELVYNDSSGSPKGVTGTLTVSGDDGFSRELLLGTCSSGRCRYDEGVSDGTFTIRLRDEQGRLMSKFETGFHLQNNTRELVSADSRFTFTSQTTVEEFVITMGTFGLPGEAPEGEIVAGPYGVFSSDTDLTGMPEFSDGGIIYGWDGKRWVKVDSGQSTSANVFLLVSE